MTNDKLVNFKAPKNTVETAKAKLNHGEMSERLRKTLEEIAHGKDVAEQTRVKERLKKEREERREIEREIRDKQQERDEKDRIIERLEEKLDTLSEQEGEYDGFLQSIEADLHDGKHVWKDHGKIEEAAELVDCRPKDVIEDLKERNPNLPESRFNPKDVGK